MFKNTQHVLLIVSGLLWGCSDADFSASSASGKRNEATSSPSSTPTSEAHAVPETPQTITPVVRSGDFSVEIGRIERLPLSMRVGVNHEDQTINEDYNDAVLCFIAKVRIDGQRIFSAENQQNIVVHLTNRSACAHTMEISLVDQAGNIKWVSHQVAPIKSDTQFTIPIMSKYDELRSRIYYKQCPKSSAATLPTMYSSLDPIWTRVLADQCNTTGR